MLESNEEVTKDDMVCKLGILTRPDGSAFLCQGETAVLASISGPLEAKLTKMSMNKSIVEAHFRPKGGISGIRDRLYEDIIQKLCDNALLSILHPRTAITIVIQEMQNAGGIIACAVNAACLALLNSGIDMKCLIAAISCTLDKEGIFNFEPDRTAWDEAQANLVFVFESNNKDIVACHVSGNFTNSQFKEALQSCKDISESVFEFYKIVIKSYYT